jgi:hypothetical protein
MDTQLKETSLVNFMGPLGFESDAIQDDAEQNYVPLEESGEQQDTDADASDEEYDFSQTTQEKTEVDDLGEEEDLDENLDQKAAPKTKKLSANEKKMRAFQSQVDQVSDYMKNARLENVEIKGILQSLLENQEKKTTKTKTKDHFDDEAVLTGAEVKEKLEDEEAREAQEKLEEESAKLLQSQKARTDAQAAFINSMSADQTDLIQKYISKNEATLQSDNEFTRLRSMSDNLTQLYYVDNKRLQEENKKMKMQLNKARKGQSTVPTGDGGFVKRDTPMPANTNPMTKNVIRQLDRLAKL